MLHIDEIAKNAFVDIKIPMRLKSVNIQECWQKRHARSKNERFYVNMTLKPRASCISLPVEVLIVRYASKKMDSDNFIAACKYLKDEIANILVPTNRSGSTDEDSRISWKYMQKNGEYCVRIIISKREEENV